MHATKSSMEINWWMSNSIINKLNQYNMNKNLCDWIRFATQKIFGVLLLSSIIYLVSCTRVAAIFPLEDKDSKSDINSTLSEPEIFVNDIGANGTDTLNDTWAFQKAIDSMAALGGGIVRVRTGNYYINVDTSINMKSHVTLYMYDTTRKLIAIATDTGRYNVISIRNVSDVTIMGGKIIGERYIHTGPVCANKCEQGYGIGIYGSNNIKVTRTHIANCWGDGIMLTGSAGISSKNITLKRVTSFNNRRQGLSILRVDGVTVDSCAFMNTNGTAPQDGIDIEPDSDTAQNITITNCEFGYNVGNGIEMNAKPTTSAVIRNVTVQNNYIHHSKYAGYIQHVDNLIFNNNTFDEIQYGPPLKVNDCVNCTLVPNTGS
jgi:polygalacturonase